MKDSTHDKMAGLTRGIVLGWLVQGFALMGKWTHAHTDIRGQACTRELRTNI